MQHFRNPWTILLFLVVALISWKWQVIAILLGAELCSQSLHERIHHPSGWFASARFRLIGIIIAGVGTWFLV